jgi:predicted outer membrane repeat protein
MEGRILKYQMFFKNLGVCVLTLFMCAGLSTAFADTKSAQGSVSSGYLFDQELNTLPSPIDTRYPLLLIGDPLESKKVSSTGISRYYVSKDGDNSDPKAGWETAFKSLQDAIAFAGFTGGGEIWVAAGVYYPDEGGAVSLGDRTETFHLLNGIKLYGGFDTSDTKLTDRDWEKNVTVLSGDIDKNDLKDSDGVVVNSNDIFGYNAHHVLSAYGVDSSVVLDGFIVTGGDAEFSTNTTKGGGLICDGSGIGNLCSLSLRNIKFRGNKAKYGGALHNNGDSQGNSSPTFTNVEFSGNSAINGGAIDSYCDRGTCNPSFTKVIFSNNFVTNRGGAINHYNNMADDSIVLNNVSFMDNRSGNEGGALRFRIEDGGTSTIQMTNVTFSGNYAATDGGAVFYEISDAGTNVSNNFVNIAFTGNSAALYGGAVYSESRGEGKINSTYTNVTFSGNWSSRCGGAVYNIGESEPESPNNTELRNSILWNNADKTGIILRVIKPDRISGDITDSICNESATTIIIHSLVEGSGGSSKWIKEPSYIDGGANIDTNPKFIMPVNPSRYASSSGNLRLKYGSPAIDAGADNYVIGLSADLDGKPRILDGNLDGRATVDMGAYEVRLENIFDTFLPLMSR